MRDGTWKLQMVSVRDSCPFTTEPNLKKWLIRICYLAAENLQSILEEASDVEEDGDAIMDARSELQESYLIIRLGTLIYLS